ncbi:helix-turn-helix domain-containing protein [Amycolatopsis regifaucium]|uniref:HTH cro/C1-type domain-containing protein n=1 Tax=Amycolatopsis regifaucium TaxID=546365 RepID=A0ABX3DQ27_9PSEU|nr:XRE family transcriptional regulator [Amycolatopsis regifaucium]OKA06123.1 hypothetical protein ATP06_0223495 [Amycolatopsis regifaucium]SFG72555.1 Zn-dependent peptidase ImmA, M78 family [Amycolatopsis regifaucium]
MFKPSRLTLARKRRGKTLVDVAARIGITSQSLSNIERGVQEPSNATLRSLSAELRFPVSFFFGSDIELLDADQVSFRARTRMTAKAREASLSSGVLAEEFYEWLGGRFSLPPVRLPVIDPPAKPELSAEHVRSAWNLGDTDPIINMIHLLEAHGVAVFSLPPEYADVDAFSFWRGSRPFVLLNTLKTAERSRFDAAHELGHLVMHGANGCGVKGRPLEKEANEFASAFLMPKMGLKKSVPETLTTDKIISYKRKWKVSAMAMAYRLHDAGYLTDWVYRRVVVELGRLGFGKAEPGGIDRETSKLLGKVSDSLRSRGSSIVSAARDLNVHPSDLNEIIFGIGVVSSTPSGSDLTSGGNRERKLKLIHSK